jgi:Bacterial dnaA protein helix-turn-helix
MYLVESSSERKRHCERTRRARPSDRPRVGLRALLEQTVARVFDVEMDLMRLPTRGRARVALARQVAMYLAHVGCGLSLTEAGELFDRDRTTAAHACHMVEARREDPGFDRAIELLERVVTVLSWPLEAACQA